MNSKLKEVGLAFCRLPFSDFESLAMNFPDCLLPNEIPKASILKPTSHFGKLYCKIIMLFKLPAAVFVSCNV